VLCAKGFVQIAAAAIASDTMANAAPTLPGRGRKTVSNDLVRHRDRVVMLGRWFRGSAVASAFALIGYISSPEPIVLSRRHLEAACCFFGLIDPRIDLSARFHLVFGTSALPRRSASGFFFTIFIVIHVRPTDPGGIG